MGSEEQHRAFSGQSVSLLTNVSGAVGILENVKLAVPTGKENSEVLAL